ncbi:uncharacterized protein L3040_006380 [Drepanopeziza brunnea f. sp. 'multigermtubi']|uniref:uncharacterized protein n=1 Tax=Drepanopeziza brunnea f. sp. 'multigermtubi' TaxID=698441 RepID=UPI002389BEA7|nr:hypothetical protein L3040_006380 [Drepanopeziza brunnea f. sp. 'multigermtubi']
MPPPDPLRHTFAVLPLMKSEVHPSPSGLASEPSSPAYAAVYRHTFGKHKHKTLQEIEACDLPYIEWLRGSYMAKNSRDLQKALQAYDAAKVPRSPASLPHMTESQASPASQKSAAGNKRKMPPQSDEQPRKKYVLDFGLNRGRALSDVPDEYVENLRERIRSGTFTPKPALVAALKDHKPSKAAFKPTWTPPELSQASPVFQDDTFGDLWIGYVDAQRFFGLNSDHFVLLPYADPPRFFGLKSDHFAVLPRAEASKSSNFKGKYWLYHVYDIFMWHVSKDAADKALKAFLACYQDRVEDVWASMGLGAGLC